MMCALPSPPLSCPPSPPYSVRAFQTEFDSLLKQMYTTEDYKSGRTVMESRLLQSNRLLHPLHALLFNVNLAMIGACRETDDFRGQKFYTDKVIAALEKCFDHPHPETADAYLSLGEALMGIATTMANASTVSHCTAPAQNTAFTSAMARRADCSFSVHPPLLSCMRVCRRPS
jgi:hypothetical protein